MSEKTDAEKLLEFATALTRRVASVSERDALSRALAITVETLRVIEDGPCRCERSNSHAPCVACDAHNAIAAAARELSK